ncbi:hypothetical protein V8C86DRAFT_3026619 [Haematococcus lacustris]
MSIPAHCSPLLLPGVELDEVLEDGGGAGPLGKGGQLALPGVQAKGKGKRGRRHSQAGSHGVAANLDCSGEVAVFDFQLLHVCLHLLEICHRSIELLVEPLNFCP